MTDDELVAGVAHQVKTPIAVIRGYAELLAVRDDEATRREAADQIREAAEVLDFMVDDLIVAFALEAEVMPFEPAPVDVGRAADEVVARLSTRFGRHTFVTRFGGASPARADIEHLDRILATLVFNACRLSPDGGEVVIEGLDEDDVVKVSV